MSDAPFSNESAGKATPVGNIEEFASTTTHGDFRLIDAETRVYLSYHRYYLLLSLIAVVFSFLLTPAPPQGESVKLGRIVLPPSCPSQILFKARCPGCGLTRSFVALAHGQWIEAIDFHRLGPLFFFICVLQIPYRIWRLRIGLQKLSFWQENLFLLTARFLLIALIVNWFVLLKYFSWLTL